MLGAEELGDGRPSQFLHHLQQLAGDAVRTDGASLCELFLQRLPSNVRMVLAAVNDTVPISELANLADKIKEVATPSLSTTVSPNISAVGPSSHFFNSRRKSSHFILLPLNVHLAAIPQPSYRLPRHLLVPSKIGSSAHKCRAPCSHSGNTSAGHATHPVIYCTLLTKQLDYVLLWTPELKLVSSHLQFLAAIPASLTFSCRQSTTLR